MSEPKADEQRKASDSKEADKDGPRSSQVAEKLPGEQRQSGDPQDSKERGGSVEESLSREDLEEHDEEEDGEGLEGNESEQEEMEVHEGGDEKASEVGPPVAQIDMKKIRPSYSEKFRPGIIQAILTEEIQELLLDKVYEEDKAQGWITELCTKINGKVKELGFPRYKHITNVTIGERRGQGIILGTKCVWDVDSDYSAYYSYSNDSLFCNAIVYGLYYY